MRLPRWLIGMIAALIAVHAPARADDIGAAARGVVRVVIIASADGEEIGRGHGSGFAVAPDEIVTNAHVVELAKRFPSLVTIDVVPESGGDHHTGELIGYDADRDLALIRFDGPPLPVLTLFSPALPDGADLVSLGYPANVDRATDTSLSQMLMPTAPVRSTGILSAHRSAQGLETIEHTAQIARGNSGGPLLDPCGRVVGVNRAVTSAEEGDGSFVISLGESELAAFLKQQKVDFRAVAWPCTSMASALEQAQERSRQQAQASEQTSLRQRYRAVRVREAAIDAARQRNEDIRDDMMAGAALLLVLGALAVGGGGLAFSLGRRRAMIWALSGGGALMLGAIVLFVMRPDFDPDSVPMPQQASDAGAASPAYTGKLMCTLDPDRSRITVSSGEDVQFDWGADGCLSDRTQYVEKADGWRRVLVPAKDQTVSVDDYDPMTRTFTSDRYLLGRDKMAQLRQLRPDAALKNCTTQDAKLAELASRQSAVRASLPQQPDERLVYACAPAS